MPIEGIQAQRYPESGTGAGPFGIRPVDPTSAGEYPSRMETWPLRLKPGTDLRQELEALTREKAWMAAFVVAGIGSLSKASLRLASAPLACRIDGNLELLCLSGTLCPDGAHLHASVSDADGQILGGHVGQGCIVRTTAEILVAVLPEWRFAREFDASTGYVELVIREATAHSTSEIAYGSPGLVPQPDGAPRRQSPHD